MCADFSETGAQCSSGKQGGGRGGGRMVPKLALRIYIWFPCLKLKHRQSPHLLSGPGEYILQQQSVLSGTIKFESHMVGSWSEFKVCLGSMKVSASILRCWFSYAVVHCIKPPYQVIFACSKSLKMIFFKQVKRVYLHTSSSTCASS